MPKIEYKETFLDRHPTFCIVSLSVISLLVLAGLCVLNSIFSPPRDYSHEQDAAARCRSLDGEFSYGNLKCYINGKEV